MYKPRNFTILLLFIFSLVGCCSGKTVIVLLPDRDHQVGQIEIRNKYGVSTLSLAGDAVSVKRGDAPTPILVPDEKVKQIFADALSSEPITPEKYILYFLWDSIELSPASSLFVDEIIAEARKRASTDISVNGHTDRCGSNKFNIGLSHRRAEKVKDLLIAGGIASEAISVTSHGEGNLLIKTEDNAPEPRNRRVEVIVR
ncbi:MAG: OmpA family protein [Thermodesulfobacteriota bacterium]|nr:OmpA family protein [Thermodesulfobacteriota bacterium]